MPRPVDLVNDALVDGTGVVTMRNSYGHAIKKIPCNGHEHFTLSTIQGGADTGTVLLKGTNNPDPADTNGETLITNTHVASDQKDGSAANKGWRYVFVHVTAEGAGAGVSFAAAGGIRLHGTGKGAGG